MPVKLALLSVSDKTGIVDRARLGRPRRRPDSTGGTASFLRSAGLR
jgi:AICAR transformylase/IMP cyclohydrolase PurH